MTTPVADDDSYNVDEDNVLTVAVAGVLDGDTDADGDALSAVLVTRPTNGSLVFSSNGSFTYFPRFNFNGTDSFTYKANDGTGDSNVATVTINVAAVNDAPFLTTTILQVTTAEDVAIGGQLTAVDIENDPFTFSSPPELAPQHGIVTVDAAGNWTYTPSADFNGTDIFGYHVTDERGASRIGEVDIRVTPVPDAADDQYSVDEDSTLVVSVDPVFRLHMISDPGDFVGQGLTWDFSQATAAFSARENSDSGVSLLIDPPSAASAS
jgi:VCBS repeat-containing protein